MGNGFWANYFEIVAAWFLQKVGMLHWNIKLAKMEFFLLLYWTQESPLLVLLGQEHSAIQAPEHRIAGNPHFISSPGEDHFTCRIDFGLYSKTYLMPSPCTRKYNLHEILNLMLDLVSANIGPFKSWPNCTSRAAVQVSCAPCTRLEMLFWKSWTHCVCYSVDLLLTARYTRASLGPTLNVSESSQNCVPARGTFACRTRLRQNTDNWFPSDVFPSPDSGTDVTSTISTALADWHN